MDKVTRITLCVLVVSLISFYNTNAQAPDGPCTDTGPLCRNDCSDNQGDGDYQWCGGCGYFIQCSSTVTYYQKCPGEQVWNDRFKACTATSNTCFECVGYKPSSSGSPTSTTPLPIERQCETTGSVCVESCPGTANGNYQWCGRCDYFIQCVGGLSYYTACQQNLFYDHNLLSCEFQSATCFCVPIQPPTGCASNPCLQDGTCTDSPEGGYTCTCRPGWTGTHCEIDIDQCQSSPCLNGATCYDGDNIYFCDCLNGYTGSRCETDIDECASTPCQNGGTCSDRVDGYMCNCPPQYTGRHCETATSVPPCDPNPCLNGGTCEEDGSGGFTCHCTPEFTGVFCDNVPDGCASFPCRFGSTCISQPGGGWSCNCPPGFTGVDCFSNVDECESMPCVDGSTCIDMDNGYRCQCRPGFTGSDCSTIIRPCDSSPCFHGGTCRNIANTFQCDCPSEYYGSRCEIVRPPPVQPTCGHFLKKAPSSVSPKPGWHIVCYLLDNDTALVDTKCENLIQGIAYYDSGHELLVAGGNYGCWVGKQYPDDDQLNSCHDDYQHDFALSGCLGCILMSVCIRYPVEPPPPDMTTEGLTDMTTDSWSQDTFEMRRRK